MSAGWDSWVEKLRAEHPKEYAEAQAVVGRAIERPCREGHCIEWADPETGEVIGGFGPADCPCS